MITTSSVANPKPVQQYNWTGNPIKPGETYYGSSTPQTRTASAQSVVQVFVPVQRKARRKRTSTWSAEAKAAFGQRMREYWAKRKAGTSPAQTP